MIITRAILYFVNCVFCVRTLIPDNQWPTVLTTVLWFMFYKQIMFFYVGKNVNVYKNIKKSSVPALWWLVWI